ncbi:retrovirus-related pol polyprotein from transposon TNT 1-94 [Tanacetum coccineum]
MEIKESKDLSSLALDELIAKKKSSDDETSTYGSDNKEYAMAVRNFKKFFRRNGRFVRQLREEKKSFRQRDDKKVKSDRKCFRCGDSNRLIGECSKPPRNKDQKSFIEGSWSDSENQAEDKTNDETYLMAQSSNEVMGLGKNGLYVMKLGNKSQDKLCLVTVVDNSTLWHRRLGHASMRLIQSLSSKELVRNLPELKGLTQQA